MARSVTPPSFSHKNLAIAAPLALALCYFSFNRPAPHHPTTTQYQQEVSEEFPHVSISKQQEGVILFFQETEEAKQQKVTATFDDDSSNVYFQHHSYY